MEKKLTERQQRFVKEYTDCGNGAEAARRAGYSEDNARNQAVENLAKPNIQAAIAELMDEAGITKKELLKVLKEGLAATKPYFNQKGEGEPEEKAYDDFVTRHKYLDTALKLRDMFPADRHELITKVLSDDEKEERLTRIKEMLAEDAG